MSICVQLVAEVISPFLALWLLVGNLFFTMIDLGIEWNYSEWTQFDVKRSYALIERLDSYL
jgi:hypothetical protein